MKFLKPLGQETLLDFLLKKKKNLVAFMNLIFDYIFIFKYLRAKFTRNF